MLLSWLLNVNRIIFLAANITFFAILFFYRIKKSFHILHSKTFLYFLFFYFTNIFIQFSMRDFGGAFWYGDWYMHYDISVYYYNNQIPESVFKFGYDYISRTPMLNILCAYFFKLFDNNDFWVYQILAAFFSSFVFFGVIMFLRTFSRSKFIYLVLSFFVCNFLFLHLLNFLVPKLLPLYFFICAVYLLKKKLSDYQFIFFKTKYIILFSLSITSACFTHLIYMGYFFSLFFIVAIFVLQKKIKFFLKEIFIISIIFVLPFALWSSKFIKTNGSVSLLKSSPQYVLAKENSFTLKKIVKSQFYNVLDTFVPARLFKFMHFEYKINNSVKDAYNNLLRLYASTLPGGLGLILTLCLIKCLLNYNSGVFPFTGDKFILYSIIFIGATLIFLSITIENPGGLIQGGLCFMMLTVLSMTIINISQFISSDALKKIKVLYTFEQLIIYCSFLIIPYFTSLDGDVANITFKHKNNLIFLSDLTKPELFLILSLILIIIQQRIYFSSFLKEKICDSAQYSV